MTNFILNGKTAQADEDATILEAAAANGVDIPTLCYLKKINCIGSCRVCLVDVEDQGLVAACNTPVQEGMVVDTNTPEVAAARRANLQAIMDDHRAVCATCARQNSCALRWLSQSFDLADSPEPLPEKGQWNEEFPLQRDSSKCIKCMRCVAVCDKIQHCNVWDFTGVGPNMKVIVRDNLPIEDAGCALCGQCITHCPTGALTARDDVSRVLDAILDPNVMTVVQVAPAVRAAYGEDLHLAPELATPGRLAAACRALGFDKVFDTDFAADLTIMEEGSEFVEFLKSDKPRPMFTSCCPGWVRFVKLHYPQFTSQLSSAKSPHQMLGALAKNTLAEEAAAASENGKKLFVVSIMPCVAKKYECSVPELRTEADPDVDAVLTVREFGRFLKMLGVKVKDLPEENFDNPLGTSTGAATLFGRTGGVMEAALRSAVYLLTGENPDFGTCDTTDATPETPWIARELNVAGTPVRIGVASGLENTAKLLDAIEAGEEKFDFVEIMACPGGCVGGGGQPIRFNKELGEERAKNLNTLDANDKLRYSHENPDVLAAYDKWLEKPLSHTSHEWLHTNQEEWTI